MPEQNWRVSLTLRSAAVTIRKSEEVIDWGWPIPLARLRHRRYPLFVSIWGQGGHLAYIERSEVEPTDDISKRTMLARIAISGRGDATMARR